MNLPSILPATRRMIFSIFMLQLRYQRKASTERVTRLVRLQVRMMCHNVPGRLGHARWLIREISAVKALRDG